MWRLLLVTGESLKGTVILAGTKDTGLEFKLAKAENVLIRQVNLDQPGIWAP